MVKILVNYSSRNQDQQILCLNQICVKKLLGKSIGVIKTVLVGLKHLSDSSENFPLYKLLKYLVHNLGTC